MAAWILSRIIRWVSDPGVWEGAGASRCIYLRRVGAQCNIELHLNLLGVRLQFLSRPLFPSLGGRGVRRGFFCLSFVIPPLRCAFPGTGQGGGQMGSHNELPADRSRSESGSGPEPDCVYIAMI